MHNNEVSGSLQYECEKHLTNLFNQSHVWLLKASYNVCKSREEAECLVSDLYEYLHKKCNPKIFWGESYNLMYCLQFIKHRWINKTSKLNRVKYVGVVECNNNTSEEYDYQKDEDIMKAYDDVKREIDRLKKTKQFASAMIYEHYWFSEDNLNEVSDKIGISKSTTFIHIKKVKQHMKEFIDNPFK
jgi:DNA-directed RNA polymerase specialized sigma24 family protein